MPREGCCPGHRNPNCHCPGPGLRLERFLEPCLLLLLSEQPAHGYDLLERLGQLGLASSEAPDPGSVYRYLRRMEEMGYLTSTWDTNCPGPAKRLYTVTECGTELLSAWASSIRDYVNELNRFTTRFDQLAGGAKAERGGD